MTAGMIVLFPVHFPNAHAGHDEQEIVIARDCLVICKCVRSARRRPRAR